MRRLRVRAAPEPKKKSTPGQQYVRVASTCITFGLLAFSIIFEWYEKSDHRCGCCLQSCFVASAGACHSPPGAALGCPRPRNSSSSGGPSWMVSAVYDQIYGPFTNLRVSLLVCLVLIYVVPCARLAAPDLFDPQARRSTGSSHGATATRPPPAGRAHRPIHGEGCLLW